MSTLFSIKLKKHYCPKSNKRLAVKKVDKTVHSKSDEANDFDFDNGVNFMRGDVKATPHRAKKREIW